MPVKGNWQLDGSMQSKIMALAFAMAAEIEHDLPSQRTKQALRARKSAGITLGRPKGPGKSKLDPYQRDIETLLAHGSTQKYIAHHYRVTEATVSRAKNAGVLNVRHSYKYRSLDDYLIAKADCEGQREAYLQRADLTGVADWPSTLQTLAVGLDAQYRQTNQRIWRRTSPTCTFGKMARSMSARQPPI